MSFVDFGAAATGALFGLALEGHNDRRQLNQQARLGQIQMNQQYEMWQKTNYPAQVKQLEMAGLNPALMYGMKGGGGTTTGNISGGQAPAGGHEIMELQNFMLQKELIKAQTEKTKEEGRLAGAQADKTTGPDTAKITAEIDLIKEETEQVKQNIENLKAREEVDRQQAEILRVAASVSRQTIMEQIHAVETNLQIQYAELTRKQQENQITFSSMNDLINLNKWNALNALTQNQLIKAGVNVSNAEIAKINNQILIDLNTWQQEYGDGKDGKGGLQERRVKVQETVSNTYKRWAGVQAVGGAIGNITDIFTSKGFQTIKTLTQKPRQPIGY